MKINYMWLMNVTSNAMEAYYDYVRACKKPYKNMKEYEERCKLIDMRSKYHDKQNEAFWAVHTVTGIPYDVLYNAVRIERNYEKKKVRLVECFSGIMDLSFMGFQGEAEELEALAGNMPGWGTVFSLPMDDLLSLDVPIASMGTSGKDAHKDTERLELDYSFRIAPQLLERLIARLGEASGKAGGDENANTAH